MGGEASLDAPHWTRGPRIGILFGPFPTTRRRPGARTAPVPTLVMHLPRRRLLPLVLVTPLLVLLPGCGAVYYKAMEQLGMHARDILVERVVEAKEVQTVAQEQFQSALEAFQNTTGFEGGELEAYYKKIKKEYDRSVDRADAVKGKIDDVESASKQLFSEWSEEIADMNSPEYRAKAEDQKREAESRYQELVGKMREAESKMYPVLEKFEDRVLYIKSSLNFAAISSLEGDLGDIEDDVADLIADMRASIEEADAFIAHLETGA